MSNVQKIAVTTERTISSSDTDCREDTSTAALSNDSSDATEAERRRFQKVFPKLYETKIKSYLDWRRDNVVQENLPLSDTSDEEKWNWATQTELSKFNNATDNTSSASSSPKEDEPEETNNSSPRNEQSEQQNTLDCFQGLVTELPQVVFCHKGPEGYFRDKDGVRILHVLSARLDPTLADAQLYTNAMALYLDQLFDRHKQEEERVTILLDVRPGQGWKNPPALELVGLIRHAATRLHDLYPDRLHKCILYPIPRPAIFIWKMVQIFLDASVREAVCLIPGDAYSTKAPLPRKHLLDHVDEACLDFCEKTRLDTFAH